LIAPCRATSPSPKPPTNEASANWLTTIAAYFGDSRQTSPYAATKMWLKLEAMKRFLAMAANS